MKKAKRMWEVISGYPAKPRGFICFCSTYAEAKRETYRFSPAYIKRGPDYGKGNGYKAFYHGGES